MPADLNGKLFKAGFSLVSLKVEQYSRVWGGSRCLLAGQCDSGLGGESASPLSFLFSACFRLSRQTGGFKPSVSPCGDAEGYLSVAAAGAESAGGGGGG